jgi:BirA family biotin operon repressor/biotin-[acetyl-CoA-carboxylase] ligase
VGLNVNQTVFKSDAPNPVSLINIIGREVERERLLSDYLERFEAYLQMLSSDRCEDLHQRYLHRLYRLGKWADYRDAQGSFSARIVDVEYAGTLVVALPDGTQRRYAFKEVQYE